MTAKLLLKISIGIRLIIIPVRIDYKNILRQERERHKEQRHERWVGEGQFKRTVVEQVTGVEVFVHAFVVEDGHGPEPVDVKVQAAGEFDVDEPADDGQGECRERYFACHGGVWRGVLHGWRCGHGGSFCSGMYRNNSSGKGVGFFQIGGGIAGDFPICVVSMMYQDLEWEDVPFWSYFCQISDFTTSYGSYSGAVPNEKITWGKLDIDTPKYIVESDATIVAPLIFAYILNQ